MVDTLPDFETKDIGGSTVDISGTAVSGVWTFVSAAGGVEEFLIQSHINNNKNSTLQIRLAVGNGVILGPGDWISWGPRGDPAPSGVWLLANRSGVSYGGFFNLQTPLDTG